MSISFIQLYNLKLKMWKTKLAISNLIYYLENVLINTSGQIGVDIFLLKGVKRVCKMVLNSAHWSSKMWLYSGWCVIIKCFIDKTYVVNKGI